MIYSCRYCMEAANYPVGTNQWSGQWDRIKVVSVMIEVFFKPQSPLRTRLIDPQDRRWRRTQQTWQILLWYVKKKREDALISRADNHNWTKASPTIEQEGDCWISKNMWRRRRREKKTITYIILNKKELYSHNINLISTLECGPLWILLKKKLPRSNG